MSNRAAVPSVTREGLNITLELRGADIAASEVWTVAGWQLQFVRLDAHRRLGVDHSAGQVYIKVVTGELVDPEHAPFCRSKSCSKHADRCSRHRSWPERCAARRADGHRRCV